MYSSDDEQQQQQQQPDALTVKSPSLLNEREREREK
jgi:hypothetical protein